MPRRRIVPNVESEASKRSRRSDNERLRRAQFNEEELQEHRVNNAETQRQIRLYSNEQQQAERPISRLTKNIRSRNTALLQENFNENNIPENFLGSLSVKCTKCDAKYFKDETLNSCCDGGSVKLEIIRYHPSIQEYFVGSDANSQNFRENIRSFNSAMAFASMGANVDNTITGRGPFCYRIHGQIYHRTGALHPADNNLATYAQLYILDSSEATDLRMKNSANQKCLRSVMENLQNLLQNINPFADLYKQMVAYETRELLENGPVDICMTFLRDTSLHPGRTNAPTIQGEIAAIFHNSDGEPPFNRDITVHWKSGALENISILSKHCDPMCYPLLFPYGDCGWTTNIKKQAKQTLNNNIDEGNDDEEQEEQGNLAREENASLRNVTQLQWYAHRFAIRDGFNQFLNSGKLTHQFFVDAYCKTEANRLNWIKENQEQIRAEDYDVLAKYVNNLVITAQTHTLGKKVILPSGFQGSPRNMMQNYQDAMAMVRKYGKPDLFITFTCNPRWQEIKDSLLPKEQPADRPDLVARVFHMKLNLLIKELKEKHIFGRVIAMLHVIEFQKRGLPHAHILLILVPEDKAWEKEKIDKIVCAELPNKETHPRLFQVIKTCMIHGPCGLLNPSAPCMENNICTKKFPKEFCNETNANVNGYPIYERKDDGNFIEISGNRVDNRWVVPYNPYLSLKYNAHINVEICTSIQSVKYLFKYVYKGHDCANVKFSAVPTEADSVIEWDEIKSYLDARYVSAPESCWRLRKYKMHAQTHHIERLNIHLENKQSLCYRPGEEAQAVESRGIKSKLLSWFKLNQVDPSAQNYLYIDIPEHYTWNQKHGEWKPRKRGFCTTIGRMYAVSPTEREKFFLRLLLLHVRGAKSFEDLRRVDDNPNPFDTYQEACIARGLLQDDSEWDICLTEAESMSMPVQLRQLFAFICVMCEPADPLALFERHKQSLTEDYLRKYPTGDKYLFLALREIEFVLLTHGKVLNDFKLPSIPPEIYQELSFADEQIDPEAEQLMYEEKYAMLNFDQKSAFDQIVNAIENTEVQPKAFFIDGPGGSGKTFLYNTLMHYVKSKKKVVLPCAFTGIAATLLTGGRTSHNRFKLPVPLTETSTCNVKLGSKAAHILNSADLVIWDEATMAPSHAVNAVDTLFRELKAVRHNPLIPNSTPFGNAVFVFGGDFRQTLPIVLRGNRTQILAACIKNAKCWKYLSKLNLKQNMRANSAQENQVGNDFSEWLLKLGDGLLQEPGLAEGTFQIPENCVVSEANSIVDEIFPNVITPETVDEIANIAILTPKNDDALKLSEDVLDKIETESKTYNSADEIQNDGADAEANNLYPIEFLNSLTPGGMPPHRLNLKIGAVVILLRNIDSSRALCNGTRLVVKQMMSKLIDCEVLTGSSKGRRVFIPRFVLAPSDPDLPFTLKRRQFPIRLAFAMTINKSQGQTLNKVGIYLPSPVFSHGQLYVAFSRTKSFEQVRVKVLSTAEQGNLKKDNRVFTKNVVFKEVFAP